MNLTFLLNVSKIREKNPGSTQMNEFYTKRHFDLEIPKIAKIKVKMV